MSAPIVHGGGITAAAATFGGRPEDWLDLSTGINPCPVALPDIPARAWHRLPDRHLIDEARRAARDHYRSGEILPLPVPGTQSVIQLLPRLVEADRLVGGTDNSVAVTDNRVAVTDNRVAVTDNRVAVVSPTYGEYARAFASAGFAVDAVDDIAAIGAGHRLAVVVNPNNPDGLIWLSRNADCPARQDEGSGRTSRRRRSLWRYRSGAQPCIPRAAAFQSGDLSFFRQVLRACQACGSVLRLRAAIFSRVSKTGSAPGRSPARLFRLQISLLRSDVSPIRGRINERCA